MQITPLMRGLRDDPRWQRLLGKMGFAPACATVQTRRDGAAIVPEQAGYAGRLPEAPRR